MCPLPKSPSKKCYPALNQAELRFLLRGLQAVRAEWRLICLTHNILKLFRSFAWAAAG